MSFHVLKSCFRKIVSRFISKVEIAFTASEPLQFSSLLQLSLLLISLRKISANFLTPWHMDWARTSDHWHLLNYGIALWALSRGPISRNMQVTVQFFPHLKSQLVHQYFPGKKSIFYSAPIIALPIWSLILTFTDGFSKETWNFLFIWGRILSNGNFASANKWSPARSSSEIENFKNQNG